MSEPSGCRLKFRVSVGVQNTGTPSPSMTIVTVPWGPRDSNATNPGVRRSEEIRTSIVGNDAGSKTSSYSRAVPLAGSDTVRTEENRPASRLTAVPFSIGEPSR